MAAELVLITILQCGSIIGYAGWGQSEGVPNFIFKAEPVDAGEEPAAAIVAYLQTHSETLKMAWDTTEGKPEMCVPRINAETDDVHGNG